MNNRISPEGFRHLANAKWASLNKINIGISNVNKILI